MGMQMVSLLEIYPGGSYQRILRCVNSSDANVNGIISQLGSMFEVDKYKINGGYPVLSWENGKYNK